MNGKGGSTVGGSPILTLGNFATNMNGVTGTFRVITDIKFVFGGYLSAVSAGSVKYRTITVVNGVITSLGTESGWTTIDTDGL